MRGAQWGRRGSGVEAIWGSMTITIKVTVHFLMFLFLVLVDALVFVLVDELMVVLIDALVLVLVQVLGCVLVGALFCVPVEQFFQHVKQPCQ